MLMELLTESGLLEPEPSFCVLLRSSARSSSTYTRFHGVGCGVGSVCVVLCEWLRGVWCGFTTQLATQYARSPRLPPAPRTDSGMKTV